MADDIFSQAGFSVSRKVPEAAVAVPVAAPAAKDAAAVGDSIFSQAGFSTVGRSADQRHDDLEHVTATGAKGEPKKPGRGVWQAIKDYPGHVVQGAVDLFKAPGNLMKPNPYPEGSESWYWYEDQRDKGVTSTGIGLAGLVTGKEFPRVAIAPAVERVSSSGRAVNALVEAVGPENVPGVVNALRENPRLSIADVSDPVRTMTQGLIDPSQPKVQNLVAEKVKARQASLPEAVNTAYTEAMGPAPDVIQMVEGLKNRARDAGRKEIQPALESAKPVDVTPVVEAIDAKLQPGVQAMLNPKSQLPLSPAQQELARVKQQLVTETGEQAFDAQRLHQVQSEIGDQAYQYMKSPDPKDRAVGKQLRDINEKLIDQIDAATEGAYRPARAKFKEAKDINEAFESGFDTLKNRQGLTGALEDSPKALQKWKDAATPEEVVARRLGTRADIDQKIRTAKNQALAGESITRVEYNRDKLEILFGEKEAKRLIRVMEDAQKEAQTNAKLLGSSKTAETLAGREALKVREVKSVNPLNALVPMASEYLGSYYGVPGVGALLGGIKGAHWAYQKVGQRMDLARNYDFAKGALATGYERQQTINALLANPKVVRQLKKQTNALRAP